MIAKRTAALTAVLACVALLGATSAMASQFRAEQYEAPVSGSLVNNGNTNIEVMKLAGSALKCKTSSLSGALAAASSSLPMAVTFGNKCTWAGVLVNISPNSCQVVLNSTNEAAPFTGSLGVTCSKGGDTIVIDAPSIPCTLTIPQQSAHAQVGYENVGFNRYRAISTTMTVTGLTYVESGSGCPSKGTFENGTMSGTYTLSAKTANSGPNGLYVANEQIAAGQAKLRAESYPVYYSGNSKVQVQLGALIWMQGYLSGSASGAAEDLDMGLNLTEAGVSVIKTNGCRLVFHLTSDEAGTGAVACPTEGAKIVIEHKYNWYPCVDEIPAQSGLSGATFHNLGSGTERSVEMGIALTGIKATSTGGGCTKSGTYTDGKLNFANPIAIGESSKAAREGIWLE